MDTSKEAEKGARYEAFSTNLPPEKLYSLQRTQVLQECKTELIGWAKRRFWVVTLVVVLVGLIGGVTLVRQEIKNSVDEQSAESMRPLKAEAFQAAKQSAIAQDHLSKSQTALQNVTNTLSETEQNMLRAQETLDTISARASEMDERLLTLWESIDATSRNAVSGVKLEVDELNQKLADLNQLLYGVAGTSEQGKALFAEYEKEREKKTGVADRTKESFAENSRCVVAIYFDANFEDTALKAESTLAQEGYRVSASPIRYVAETRVAKDPTSPDGLSTVIVKRSMPPLPRSVKPGEKVLLFARLVQPKVGDVMSHFDAITDFQREELIPRDSVKQLPDQANRIEVYLTQLQTQ